MADPIPGYVCEHGRLSDSCEDCAYIRAAERGAPLGGPPPADTRARRNPAAAAQAVTEDTLVTAPDGRDVLVVSGDAIPADLAGQPARPRYPAPTAKR